MIYHDEYRHRFIQPKVTYFQSTYIPSSSSSLDLWKPIETPKKTVHFIHQPDNMVIEKSSIKLEEIEEPERKPVSTVEFEEPVVEEKKEGGFIEFSDDDDDDMGIVGMNVEDSSDSSDSEEEEEGRKTVDCCVEAVCQKREWSEKKAEIEAKRQRVEQEQVLQNDDEKEDLESIMEI